MRQLAHEGLMLLPQRRLPGRTIAAALPAVLARRDLGRTPTSSLPRGLGDRLAVMLADPAALTGRVRTLLTFSAPVVTALPVALTS